MAACGEGYEYTFFKCENQESRIREEWSPEDEWACDGYNIFYVRTGGDYLYVEVGEYISTDKRTKSKTHFAQAKKEDIKDCVKI